ncbi:MAG: putative permease component of transporter [Chloroflexi bacterium]|nr:putative permease component of transporter [Chloroflexota bacterium]
MNQSAQLLQDADQNLMSADPERVRRLRRKAVLDRLLSIVLPLLAVIVVLAFWQFFVIWRKVPPFIFPRLDDTLNSLRTNWPSIWPALFNTLQEAAIGFALANVLAIVGATIFVHSRFAERTLFPLAVVVQTVPIIVWSPILVIIMPVDSLWPQVCIAFLISFFPALVNMTQGLRMVDPLLLDLFRVLNATRRQIFRKLRWPASIPSLFASLRITSTLSLVGAIVGEYVAGSGQTIGYELITAKQSLDTALEMAVVLVATVTGVIIFLAVTGIERAVLARRGQGQ